MINTFLAVLAVSFVKISFCSIQQTEKDYCPISSTDCTSTNVNFCLDTDTYKRIAPGSVFVVPDIHGDEFPLYEALQRVGFVDFDAELRFDSIPANWKWFGGDSTVVQLGDIFDRGPSTKRIIEFLDALAEEAHKFGGCVLRILGNHEVMNLQGDFRYASTKETMMFGDLKARERYLHKASAKGYNLRSLPVVMQVNRTVFVHAGLREKVLNHFGSLRSINQFVLDVLRDGNHASISRGEMELIFGNEGPVWTRYFTQDDSCVEASRVLDKLDADRLIVGHTVQSSRVPTVRCDGKVILSDIGMSRFYGGGKGKYILIEDNEVHFV
eukprot:snap_masked-scaffold_8-processed-gene-0.10-mRNA-1 protein AED:1.00 eAED:1.00 QI:0/-1/0/0/-1/1/1/0/325